MSNNKCLGFIETFGLAACVAAADAAVKSANVKLLGYEYAKGGGMCTVKVEGKTKRVYFYGSNATECKRKYKEWKQKQAANSNNKLTFAAQYKKWLFEERQSQLKPSTFERYYGIYENYVKTSSLSEMRLTDITKDDIKKYFKDLSKKLPITTVKNVYRYIKPFFVYAVNEELIVKDVCIY